MQCKELEAVLESEGLDPLSQEAREHLAGCSSCQDLLADFSAIVTTAKSIPAEVTPPERIWVSVRAQIEAEGIIRDVAPVLVAAPVSAPWWNSLASFFRPRALATVAGGLFLVLGSAYLYQHHIPAHTTQIPQPTSTQARANQPTPAAVVPAPVESSPKLPAASVPPQTQVARVANNTVPQPRPSSTQLRNSPSEDLLGNSAAVLNAAEGSLPSRDLTDNAAVDAALRQNLRTLNEFIAECESRLRQNPQDELTREYLNSAYQQKAELLTSMMDNGRSEH